MQPCVGDPPNFRGMGHRMPSDGHPDGRIEKMTGIEAKGALSTAQDISIRGMKPGKTIVEAWPEGSAGVGGYIEGRRLEISYNPPGAAVDRFG